MCNIHICMCVCIYAHTRMHTYIQTNKQQSWLPGSGFEHRIFFLFQTPFSFGMNHRTPPYPAGDYCLLCRSERKDSSFLESGVKTASKLALSMAPKGNSVLHLPLWVCPDCRRTVEKEERHSGLDQPVSGCSFNGLLLAPLLWVVG